MLRKKDKKRDYDKGYQARTERRKERARLRQNIIQDGVKKQMADKAIGLMYASGMNMADDGDVEGGGKRQKITNSVCRFCSKPGHKTRRSANCLYHGWEEEDVNVEMVRLSIAKATGDASGKVQSKVQSEGKSELFGSGCDTTNTHCCQY